MKVVRWRGSIEDALFVEPLDGGAVLRCAIEHLQLDLISDLEIGREIGRAHV